MGARSILDDPTQAQLEIASALATVSPIAGGSVLGAFTTKTPQYGLRREDFSTNTQSYRLSRKIAGGRWDSIELRLPMNGVTAQTPNANFIQVTTLRNHEIRRPMLSEDHTAGVTTGAGWSTVNDTNAFGGSYARLNPGVAGSHIEWTSPVSATVVGVGIWRESVNGGYAVVSIDGNATLANLLPTAQQEVDAGRLAASALTANGGTLDPTHRVLSFYSNPSGFFQVNIASGAVGGKAVRIEGTGYDQIQASGTTTRLYIDRFLYDDAAATPGTAVMAREATLFAGSSEQVLAAHFYPEDVEATWAGGSHGYEVETAVAFYVDGVAVNLSNNTGLDGDNIVAIIKSTLRNPNSTGQIIAEVTKAITPRPDGFNVEVTIHHLVSGKLGEASYFGMLPRDVSFTRARNVMLPLPSDVNLKDGAFKQSAASSTMLVWQPATADGAFGSMLHLPHPWQSHRGFPGEIKLAIQDRSDGIPKVYAEVAGPTSPRTYAAGDVWRWSYVVASQWFADPEAILSAV